MLRYLLASLALVACVLRFDDVVFAGEVTSDSIDERALFRAVGRMYGFDPDLFEAIAIVESDGDSHAISSKGAMGLMQLMPGTASRFRVTDPFDPVESVLGAARLLDYLRDQQNCGNIPALLAAYNAGEEAVKRYHGIPPYAETREYVRTVLWLYLVGTKPSDKSNLNLAAKENPRAQNRVALRAPASGDQVLLDQLADLKRKREEAAQAR